MRGPLRNAHAEIVRQHICYVTMNERNGITGLSLISLGFARWGLFQTYDDKAAGTSNRWWISPDR